MILFFNKKTREIIGHIQGRVHPEQVLAVKMSMSGVDDKDIGKYVVPFKTLFAVVEEPKIGYKLIDKKKKIFKQVVVGKIRVRGKGIKMIPDVTFVEKILEFEDNLSKIREYKVELDKKGNVVGFEKKDNLA